MAYWLLKTEPSEYSADDLRKSKVATWDGVANPTALKNIREMTKGDEVVVYHTGDERRCMALATVSKPAYPDPTSDDEKAVVVDLKYKAMLKSPVTLEQIKADPAFEGWDLLRIGRLSVVSVPKPMWDRLIALSSVAPAK
ncbi:MAG: EVE domain-containing protein [Tepidisphaeraceae bacterium]